MEGSSESSWFGSDDRLHCQFYPSRAGVCGTRTKFTRARTTYIGGPSTGKLFGTAQIKIGSGKHLHLKIYPSRTLFLGTRTTFIRRVPYPKSAVV